MSNRAIALLCCALPLAAQTTLGTVTYQDQLGVAAIEQNIRWSLMDDGSPIPAMAYTTHRVVNAAGAEVPWQKMSNGDIMVRTAVAASIIPQALPTAAVGGGGTYIYYTAATCPAINTSVTALPFTGKQTPSRLDVGSILYVASCTPSGGLRLIGLSLTYGGAALTDIGATRGGNANGWYLLTVPFTTSGDTFTSAGHGYSNGQLLRFAMIDSGALPGGITAGTNYFVCNSATDTFKVSTTADCLNIVTTTTAATGIPIILSTVSYTLQSYSGGTTIATSLSRSTVGNYEQLTNGFTGARIPTAAFQAANSYALAPLQQWQLSDGTWTPSVGNIAYDSISVHHDIDPGHNPSTPTGYTITTLETGLLEISLKAAIDITRATTYSFGLTFTAAANSRVTGFSNNYPDALYVESSTISGLSAGQVVYPVNILCAGLTCTRPFTLHAVTPIDSAQLSTTPDGTPLTLGSTGTARLDILTEIPGTGGFYNLTVTLDENSKAVQLIEDHNVHNYSWSINIRPNLVADTVRSRGAPYAATTYNCQYIQLPLTSATLSGSTLTIVSPSHGLSTGASIQLGRTTGITNANDTTFTATVIDANTLTASCPTCSGTSTTGGYLRTMALPTGTGWSTYDAEYNFDLLGADRTSASTCTSSTIKWIGFQYSYTSDSIGTGYMSMMYNTTDSSTGIVAGMMLGNGGAQYMANSSHGPGIYDIPSTSSQGIQVWDSAATGSQQYYIGQSTKPWALYTTTKADIPAANAYGPINTARNALYGLGVGHTNTYALSFPDPVGGWKYQYISDAQAAQLTSYLSDGTALCGSATCFYNTVTSASVDAFGYNAAAANVLLDQTYPRALFTLQTLNSQLATFASTYYNGAGQIGQALHYYQAGYPCMRLGPIFNLLMRSGVNGTNPYIISRAKAYAAYCANFMWDPDHFSSDPEVIAGGGNGNQQSQYLQTKSQIAITLQSHPKMAPLVSTATANVIANVIGNLQATSGAGYGGWHYQGAATTQALYGLIQLKNLGQFDPASYPLLQKFAQWYESCIVPPEVRYTGSPRLCDASGDMYGASEGSPAHGLLATLLKDTNPGLSRNLAWLWNAQKYVPSSFDSFSVPPLLTLDFSLLNTKTDPQLGTQHFLGYHSAFRSGWGTAAENYVSFLYGGFYNASGHQHPDTGRETMHLLGAPVSLDWGYPGTDSDGLFGRFHHSTICLDSEMIDGDTGNPVVWSSDSPPRKTCGTEFTGNSPDLTTLIQTSTFKGSSSAIASWPKSDGTVWKRSMQLLSYDPAHPVVHIVDTFTGAQASSAKTSTINLVTADGAVTTPSGAYTPTVRSNTNNNSVLPSNGTVNTISGNGIQQFAFTGASWSNHAAGGVDFDLYTQNADTNSWLIGNWCINLDGGAPGANTCAGQKQDIFRLHGSGDFDTWIVARNKGASDPTVSAGSCGTGSVQVALAGTLCFDAHHSQYDDGAGTQTLATYDTTSASAFGMTISGGPAELVKTAGSISATVYGYASSTRALTVPSGFYPTQTLARDGSGNYLITAGADPMQADFTTMKVDVLGKTATQLIVGYTAPNDSACTIRVTDNNGGPIVSDLDTTKFGSHANQDIERTYANGFRWPTLTYGRRRVVIIGTHDQVKYGTDGKWYSPALQANSDHTVTVTCQ